MVKLLILLTLALGLFGSELLYSVRQVLDPGLYDKNRALLNIVFSKKGRYVKGGRPLYHKIFETLERTAILKKQTPPLSRVYISFYSPTNGIMSIYGIEKALKSGGIYGYEIQNIGYSDEGFYEKISFIAPQESFFSKILRAIELAKGRVLSISYLNGEYKISLDMDGFKAAKRFYGKKEYNRIEKDIWLDIEGMSYLKIIPNAGSKWYPRIFLYNCQLKPIKVVKKTKPYSSLDITLPNGSCYIKISDRFTIKNIKNGIKIYGK